MAMGSNFLVKTTTEHTLANMQGNGIEIKNMEKDSVTMLIVQCLKEITRITFLMDMGIMFSHFTRIDKLVLLTSMSMKVIGRMAKWMEVVNSETALASILKVFSRIIYSIMKTDCS
jgi:hypothetical protein